MKLPRIPVTSIAGFMALALPLQAAELPHLVILPFDNLTGQKAQDPLREGIADLLTVCFGSLADQVVVVDRSVLGDLLEEQSLGFEDLIDENSRQSSGRLFGASHLLRGTFDRSTNGLSVQGQLYDLATTQLLFTVESSGAADALAATLCDGIAPAAVAQLSDGPRPEASLTFDADPVYHQLMIAGIGHYYNGHLAGAFPAFLRILRDRPDDEAARYWLARSFYEADLKDLAVVEFKEYLTRNPENGRRAEVEVLLQEIERDGDD